MRNPSERTGKIGGQIFQSIQNIWNDQIDIDGYSWVTEFLNSETAHDQVRNTKIGQRFDCRARRYLNAGGAGIFSKDIGVGIGHSEIIPLRKNGCKFLREREWLL